MKFALLLSLALCGLVNAGDGPETPGAVAPTGKAGKAGKAAKAGKNAKGKTVAPTAAVTDRFLAIPGSSPAVAAGPVARFAVGPSCPHNNCQSCTNQAGCYWTASGCSNIPCSLSGFCAFAPGHCGGCTRDSQCGSSPRRCERGQCVGVEGDKACDFYRDCGSCLSRPNCLWDPNTLTGNCKPKEQCDFTYQQRELVIGPTALPPATACVRTLDQCNRGDFNGAPLDLNNERGVGCTNHGQCGVNQYCYSCSKCQGSCAPCKAPGRPVSGMCGPAWRCPIDNDSISNTCPVARPPVILPPVIVPAPTPFPVLKPTCGYTACGACTAAYGCVWSGTHCYYTTVPCNNRGCANTPQQCVAVALPSPKPAPVVTVPVPAPAPVSTNTNCAFNNCQNCAAKDNCVWSGQFCYFAVVPCTAPGCANTPAQCGGCTTDAQCGAGRRCSKGTCLTSAGDYSCDYYQDCVGCLSNANCLWDPNSFTHCKPKEQCDFTYRGLALGGVGTPPPATACVQTIDKCSQTNFDGAILDQNQDRGLGCTNHGQCLNGQYCFSCSKCRGECAPCYVNGIPVSGACGPISQCAIDRDSINDLCPIG